MNGHPDDAVDEMYVLYETYTNGEERRVFSSSSLSYVQLKMRHLCQAYDHCDLEVPTFKIEVG
jgi:hypothetical protein